MKSTVNRNWEGLTPGKKSHKFTFDQGTLMGGLAIIMFAYIIFRFFYPLIEKGVLW